MTRPSIMLLCTAVIGVLPLSGQKTLDVVESTFKIGLMAEEIFYYGFAEGDVLVFNFEETNNKELKELEIVEMPSTSRFLDYKTQKIENKKFNVGRTGIYKFRFTNGALGVRICKMKIQRIPASPATENFNTTVYYHMVNDTVYSSEQEDYLSKTDTVIIHLDDQVVRVNPLTIPNSNKASINFTLPERTVAWSYYISCNVDGKKLLESASTELSGSGLEAVKKFPNYNPVAAVAMGTPSYLNKLPGEGIDYWIMEGDNVTLFMNKAPFRFMKKGKAVNDFNRMEYRKGTLHFCFLNNKPEPVDLLVKITAIQVNEELAKRPVQRYHTVPRKEMYLKN